MGYSFINLLLHCLSSTSMDIATTKRFHQQSSTIKFNGLVMLGLIVRILVASQPRAMQEQAELSPEEQSRSKLTEGNLGYSHFFCYRM